MVLAAGLGAGAYFGYNWWQGQAKKDTGLTPQPPTAPADPRAGWQTYTDSENGFSIKYPPGWTTKEGSFPSTHGKTLKDTSFIGTGPKDKVFVTVRSNPEDTLKAFVDGDSVSTIENAKVDSLDGFAASTADSYRVYLGKDQTIYMFTFPGAKANTDLSKDQVNILTSFKFTSVTSSTTPTTPTTPSTPSSTPTTPSTTSASPTDSAKTYYSASHTSSTPSNRLSKRVTDCITATTPKSADLGLDTRDKIYDYCGIEGEGYFQNAAAVGDITFKEQKKTASAALLELSDKSGKKLFSYSLLLESGEWRIDRIQDLR